MADATPVEDTVTAPETTVDKCADCVGYCQVCGATKVAE